MAYHISKKTGRPNLCGATKRGCPLGANTPHFETKEAAQEWQAAEAAGQHSAFTKVNRKVVKTLEAANDFGQGPSDSYYHNAGSIAVAALGEGAQEVETVEGPDYMNYVLVRKEGVYYGASVSGGLYEPYEVMRVRQVERHTQPQHTATAKPQKSTAAVGHFEALYNEAAAAASAQAEAAGKKRGSKYYRRWDSLEDAYQEKTTWQKEGVSAAAMPTVTVERPDGSKLYSFEVEPVGNRAFSDKPYPVEVPLDDMYESEERQNSRRMDAGHVIYDTRSGKGFFFKYRTASEDSSEDMYRWSKKARALAVDTGQLQEIYLLEGDGTTQEAEYWKTVGGNEDYDA